MVKTMKKIDDDDEVSSSDDEYPDLSSSSNSDTSVSSSSDSDDDSDDSDDSSDDSSADSFEGNGNKKKTALQKFNDIYYKNFGSAATRYARRSHATQRWRERLVYEHDKKEYLLKRKQEEEEQYRKEEAQKAKREVKAIQKFQKKKNKQKRKQFLKTVGDRQSTHVKKLAKMVDLATFKVEIVEAKEKQTEEDRINYIKLLDLNEKIKIQTADELHIRNELTKKENFQEISESITKVLRKHGQLPAINIPKTPIHEDTKGTASHVILRVNTEVGDEDTDPNEDEKTSQFIPHRKLYFTINLKRFKYTEVLKGEKIGEKGGIELAKSLSTGACPRLNELDLSWNIIKQRGILALSNSFGRGSCSRLQKLDLRMNGINDRGVVSLLESMQKGAIPELEHLILQGNNLGDNGAKSISHFALKSVFENIISINIRQNNIKNTGGRALWNVFSCPNIKSLCPKLKQLDMSRNNIQLAVKKSFSPCPIHITL